MRICTIGVPRFIHDGLEVDSGWREFDFGKVEKKAQQAFIDHVGRFVQVHPADADEFAKLELEEYEDRGRRRYRRRDPNAAPAPALPPAAPAAGARPPGRPGAPPAAPRR